MTYESSVEIKEKIRQATSAAIVRRNIKVETLARELGRKPAQLYNWLQQENPQMKNNPIYLALKMTQILNDPELARILIKQLAAIL